MRELGRKAEKQDVLRIYRSHKPEIHLYPGVTEMIIELKSKGCKIGIITDGIVITDELGGVQFRKPCDIAFRIMATRWRINPTDILYVGDNANKDFQAPQQLGMKSVWFKNADGVYQQHVKSLSSISKICEIRDFIR